MTYFKLKYTLDLDQIGTFPQICRFTEGYDYNKTNACSRISRYDSEIPQVDFDFDGLLLDRHARVTDYFSTAYLNDLTGLLVSQRLFQFISSKALPAYKTYIVGIYKAGEKLKDPYYWIHYTREYPEMINFKDSKFFLNHSEAKYRPIKIKDYKEYLKLQESSEYIIDSSYLILNKNISDNYDILRIGVVKAETYITQETKDEMISNGFTGMVFEPASFLVVE